MAVQLRVGGKYRNRLGDVEEIVGVNPRSSSCYCFLSKSGKAFAKDGDWCLIGCPDDCDLIEEVTEEEVPANQMQVLVAGEWEDVVQWGMKRVADGLQGMYFFKYGAVDHGWFSADYMREKPVKKKHRVIRYVNLYADGQVGNLYDTKAECERLSSSDPCEMREVVFEWESE